jgi:hypothetical protein
MIKVIKGIILFFLLNGGILYLLEKKYASHKNTYDVILKKLEENKNTYTDIYIGNSHTQALKTYTNRTGTAIANIATPGQDLFKTYAILKKWIPLMSNLKTIYFGLDYETLGQNLSFSGLDYEDRQLYKYTDTLYKYSFENRLMARSNFFRSNRDLKFLYAKQDIEAAENYIPPAIELSTENCKKRALEHSQIRFKKSLIDENITLLAAIIKLTQVNKKRLVIYIPPKSKCYKENILKENILLAKGKIDSVLNVSKVNYYNFYNSEDFTGDYFLDYDHVNEKGRVMIIKKINEKVFLQ